MFPYIALIIVGVCIAAYVIHDVNPEPLSKFVRPIRRAWLKYNVDGFKRDLELIDRNRRNDELAAAVIREEIAAAELELKSL